MKWRIGSRRTWGWPRCASGSDRGWRWWWRRFRRGNPAPGWYRCRKRRDASGNHGFLAKDLPGGGGAPGEAEAQGPAPALPWPPRPVAGADAIGDREDRRLFGAVAVYRFPEMELLEEAEAEG